jgi:FkbM family methyltransferase
VSSLSKSIRKLRERATRAHRAWQRETARGIAIAEADGFLVAHRVGTADERVIAQSFEKDIFFARVPEYRPSASDVVLDVGAHIGTFALAAARKAPEGRVLAVEASRETYDLLRINVALNRLDNVVAEQVALTDRAGRVRLHHDAEGNWGHSIMAPLSNQGEEVPADTLGALLERHRVAQVDFAKFNCEGAEFPILLTAPDEVLRRLRLMVVLYHCDLAKGWSLEALVERLAGAGFGVDRRIAKAERGWLVAERH